MSIFAPRVGGDALLEALAAAATHPDPYTFHYPGRADVDVLVYFCEEPLPHVLYTTFGLSRVRSTVPVAGVQTELSLRTAITSPLPMAWPADALAEMCCGIRRSGNSIAPGHYVTLPGPASTTLAGFSFVDDPILGTVATATGPVRYTYAVGLTAQDLDDALRWDPVRFTGELGEVYPLGLTDPHRTSVRCDPHARARVEEAMAAEGSSISAVEATFLGLSDGLVELDPPAATALLRAARGRLKFGRPFALVSAHDETWLRITPTPGARTSRGADFLDLAAPPALADELLATFDAAPGTYPLRCVPLRIRVIDTET